MTIPELDGARVVLLSPPVFASRGWDVNLIASVHGALRPHVTLGEELTREGVAQWLQRIGETRASGT